MIKAVFPTVLPAIYQFGMNMTLEPLDFLDDGTSAQIAKLLGGGVLKVIARSVWMNDDPKTVTMTVGVPTQNYIAFADQPGAPSGAMMILNAGDLACAAVRGYYFMPRVLAVEEVLAAMIPGSTMSDAAAAALPTSPIASWGTASPIWYVPPVTIPSSVVGTPQS